MNKRMQYLVEGITKDIIVYLMEDGGYRFANCSQRIL